MNMSRSSSLSSSSLQSLIPRQPNILNPTRNFISHTRSPLPLNLKHSSSTSNQTLRTVCSSTSDNGSHHPSSQGGDFFFRGVLAKMESVYLSRNPTAKSVLDLVGSNEQISYDHFAFRTFGVNGYGIDSMARFFLDFGYTAREELRFPAKKLRALWFSPPNYANSVGGAGVNGPLPRIFISELLVDQMCRLMYIFFFFLIFIYNSHTHDEVRTHDLSLRSSMPYHYTIHTHPQTQDIIHKYTENSGSGKKYAALASAVGTLTWEKPLYTEFQQLARESEYAAWTLVNGYAVNHVTISAHQLKSELRDIKSLNQFIEKNGFKLNSEGGILKVSPDGLLLQSSTVADPVQFQFRDGQTELVPCSYIEFAQRLVLPQYSNLPSNEVKEHHRRDRFEVGNADKIFESTSKEQLTRRAA